MNMGQVFGTLEDKIKWDAYKCGCASEQSAFASGAIKHFARGRLRIVLVERSTGVLVGQGWHMLESFQVWNPTVGFQVVNNGQFTVAVNGCLYRKQTPKTRTTEDPRTVCFACSKCLDCPGGNLSPLNRLAKL